MQSLKYNWVAAAAALGALLLALPAGAAPDAKDVPPGTKGSVILDLESLTKEINTYKVQKYGIHTHFVLPKNWELVEPEKDAKTGKIPEDLPYYVVLSHAPTSQPNDPTDLVFELRIFKDGLTVDKPNLSKEEREKLRAERFWAFLNNQISTSTKMGFKLTTDRSQIKAKPYGATVDANGNIKVDADGKLRGKTGRPIQYFVPLHYDIYVKGAESKTSNSKLFTFNTFTGDTIWQLTFLVSKDQIDNYGGLIAVVMDNSFGLTDAVVKQFEEEKKKAEAAAKAKSGNK
jgi:hypothetical protein